ncbi:MAG: DUF4340 domain-containing protein [Oscillospiraceae bacterium]|nr:DUF4340 domain-containing protein [Oscillospiraceae bacterium]
MSKSTRNIIIIAAAVVLLAAGIFFVGRLDTSEDTVSATPEPSYTVYSADTSDIASVIVKNPEETIEANNLGDGAWTINNMSNDDIDKSKAYTLVSTVSKIISKNKIEENPSDLSEYGLSEPSVTVTIKKNSGEENTLYVGDKSPTLGEYFIILDGDNTVYTLYNYKVETLMNPLSYYSDFNRFSVVIDDINRIKIERDDETIEMKIMDDVSNTLSNVWEVVKPYESTANDEYIDNNVLTAIEELKFNNLVTEDGDYGMSSPTAKITLTVKPYDNATGKYGDEYTEVFTIGKVSGDTAYVSYNDKVYEVSSESVDFANAPSFNFLNKLQGLVDISLVDGVSVSFGENNDSLEIIRSGDDMSFKLNGGDADYKLTKSMYQAIISLAVDGIYRGEKLGDTVLKFEYDGIKRADDTTVEFKSINDLSCALVRNGKAEFTIKKNKLDEFTQLWLEYVEDPNNEGEEDE